MLNLACNLYFCLFFVLSLPPDWAMLKRALEAYERKHIHKVLKAQQKQLLKKLTAKERNTLAQLQTDNKNCQKALLAWQQNPTSTEDRDKILKKLAYLRTATTPLQEKYADMLAVFTSEREAMHPVWKAGMDAIIADYNAEIDDNTTPFFAKHRTGFYDDEEFLLWYVEEESASGAGE